MSNPALSAPAAEERPVVSQACHFCKSRHLKCDGSNPVRMMPEQAPQTPRMVLFFDESFIESLSQVLWHPTSLLASVRYLLASYLTNSGMAQCIQCQLRRQECIFSATPKRRGRKGRGGDESPAKRVKLANEMPAPTNGTTLKPVIPTTRAAPRLLTSQQLMTSRNVEKGDATAYRPEDLVDLILAQQAKLEQKRQDLAEADISGLIGTLAIESCFPHVVVPMMHFSPILTLPITCQDLSDFTQDSECEHTPFADVSFELDYADESALAEALFTGFSQRNGMYYPNGTVTVDVQLVKSYVHKFNSADLTRQLLNSSITEMTEAYCYGVFLSAGMYYSIFHHLIMSKCCQ